VVTAIGERLISQTIQLILLMLLQYGQKFVDMVNSRLPWYKTSNILAEWGCDFQFQIGFKRT